MQVDCMGYFGHKAPARPYLALPYAWVFDEDMFRAVFIPRPFFKEVAQESSSEVRWGERRCVGQSVWVGVEVESLVSVWRQECGGWERS